ncbi:Lipase, partial [Operophtera brumata]
MLRVVALLLCLASLVYGRRSPNADLIEQYYKTGPESGRYSNNVVEDALLDVPGLISKYGYPVEVHNVVTEDGYILEMQRIPHGRDTHNTPYILAEAGYDVWLGNARGTYYSRNHVSLNPDSSREFWQFSWEEIGARDLTAMIDYTLQVSGKSRLHYIGHSQGTTVFWTMASLRPEYNDKIISMQALAPVAYMRYNENP